MSADRGEPRGAAAEVGTVHRAGVVERTLELALGGLAWDEDELLGDLAEGRAHVAGARGGRSARRWWLGQALRAAPRLAWHGLVHRPLTIVLGLAGFVGWEWLASVAYTADWFPVVQSAYRLENPVFPPVDQVIRDTVLVGVWNVLAAAVVGAVLAALARRRGRLVPGIVSAALMALVSTRHAFYLVYGPGTCATSPDGGLETCTLELGARSNDLIVPALWQLPTMMILLPVATVLGGLAVVAWTRRRR